MTPVSFSAARIYYFWLAIILLWVNYTEGAIGCQIFKSIGLQSRISINENYSRGTINDMIISLWCLL